jgi:hypothetical protein
MLKTQNNFGILGSLENYICEHEILRKDLAPEKSHEAGFEQARLSASIHPGNNCHSIFESKVQLFVASDIFNIQVFQLQM